MLFCTNCDHNRLEDKFSATERYHECTKCNKKYKITASETLVFEEIIDKSESTIKYNTFLKNAAKDRTNPKTFKECPKCARQIVSYVIIGHQKKYIYVCECGHKF